MMKRLLILYTGGTIGMLPTADGLAPADGYLEQQLSRLARDGVSWEVRSYQPLIDSSAITIAHWQQLVRDIAADYQAFDGFVVIHGTDTMAYTASVLAFCLQQLGKPVVLTGSQLPLAHPRSDGWGNLADAIEAACQSDLHEVVIAFNQKLLRGCRARKVDCASFAGFDTPNAPHLASFGIHPAWHREHWLRSAGEFRAVLPREADIRFVGLLPGAMAASAGQWLAASPPEAAILQVYGNGNVPDTPALFAAIAELKARAVPVLVLTQCQRGAVEVGAYAASQPLFRAGAISGADMTPEAAQAKLLCLLSGGASGDAASWLAANLCGELG